MPVSKPVPSRRPAKATVASVRQGPAHRAPIAAAHFVDDAFFRHLVAHMRNGVLAIDRGGALVLINDEACRIFGLPAGEGYMGRPFAEVFHAHPAIVRVLAGAYELAFLPNRAELRLSPSDKVLGYTLSLIRNAEGLTIGAAMFFKDLTRVEQLEERERLRDRLAVLGEMAAAVAHEIKNPLAGIEVMAGLLRRQLKDNAQATALVGDIISEAKMANAIVQEILDFVRPVRLQMERTSVAAALQAAVTMADGKAKRGHVDVSLAIDEHRGQPAVRVRLGDPVVPSLDGPCVCACLRHGASRASVGVVARRAASRSQGASRVSAFLSRASAKGGLAHARAQRNANGGPCGLRVQRRRAAAGPPQWRSELPGR